MTDDSSGVGGHHSDEDDLIEIDLNFESMRRFQAEFSPNLSKDGLFIDTGEPLDPGSVVRFRVILPEEFVFLEGTAVVEWRHSAEAVSDGPPGMALRFVTLSPQNQELVEQLVQDHVDAGGTPFDLDVRPSMTDFPTDALEGAPAEFDQGSDEGYRLTVRRTAESIESEALQALAEATPDSGDLTPDEESSEDGDGEESRGFEIIEGPADSEDGGPTDEDGEARGSDTAPAEAVDDPPEIDWSTEVEALPDSGDEVGEETESGDDPDASVQEDEDSIRREPAVLRAPREFDGGPEIIDDVAQDGLGSPAFDVSLPEIDDEPDTTPMLPDDGGDDVTVPADEDAEGSTGRRRLWPFGLAAVFVIAVAGGFLLWPRFSSWMDAPGEPSSAEPVVMIEAAETEAGSEPGDDPAKAVGEETAADAELHDVVETEVGESAGEDVAAPGDEPVEADVVGPAPLERADAIATIDFASGPRGTVVSIRGNGSLEDGLVTMETLSSPPRVLVRLRGIRTSYRPYIIESATSEVTRIRIGHHEDRRPPELWVVLDLNTTGLQPDEMTVRGDLAEIVIAAR